MALFTVLFFYKLPPTLNYSLFKRDFMAILTTIVHKRKMSLILKVRPFLILRSQNYTFLDKCPYILIDLMELIGISTRTYIDEDTISDRDPMQIFQ